MADGRYIEKAALQQPYGLAIKEEFLYPAQSIPPESSWKLWRDGLSRICSSRDTLLHPLGPFLRCDTVQWWYDDSSNRLYQLNKDDTFDVFWKAVGKRTRAELAKYTFSHTESSRPLPAVPATARQSAQTVFITGTGSICGLNDTRPDPRSWILDDVKLPSNLKTTLVLSGTIKAVSDGSFKDRHGTAAWLLEIASECIIYGLAVVPGHGSDQSAYRSELTGLYGIAMTVRLLETKYSFHGTVTIGCDGLSALNKARIDSDFANPNEPQFDLITAIRQVRQTSESTWQWRHIKGHQDAVRPVQELDQWSQWNIAMDTAAKAHWNNTKGTSVFAPLFGEPWPTIVDGKKIVSNMRQELRTLCNTPPAMEYWRMKDRFGSVPPEEIDWDSLGHAMSSLPTQRQHWISKTVSGFCSTGRMMLRRKERETDACPRCGEPEDIVHVWQCLHDTEKLWDKALLDLRSWLESNGSHPEITNLIINRLSRWRLNNTTAALMSHIPWLQELIKKQDHCGWRNFFEGFLLADWYTAITHHLTRTHSWKSSW
jgi:hypothetical protein